MVPLTVLVVIPDAARADRVARAVVSAGHAPVMVADGERAIDRFVQEPADVVVAEFFLPGRDGATTVESIRWAPGGRQVHAILLATEDPESAALATIGSRIDAVATFVGEPPLGKLTEILRSLDRKAPSDPRARGAGELPPESVRWLERTTSILKGDDLASRYAGFDGHEDESTVRGSAQVARAILEAARAQTGEKSAPRHVEISTMEVASGRGAPDATRLAKRRSDEHPADVADPAALAESQGVRHAAAQAAERAEKASAPAAPDPFAGRFESTSFPQLLVRLAEARVTGGLLCIADQEPRDTISGDPPTKMVHFRGGVPIMVRSNLVDECLGQLLLRKKRIGAATLEESVRRMTLGHGLQGEILIDMGALSPFEVSETLAEQAREKLFDLFGWRHGTYRLTDAELPKDHAPLELALPDMVYEGICAAMPTTRLLDILTPMLDRYVVPDAQRLARFVRVRLPVELKAILARVDGATTLRLLLAMGSKPGAVAQLVYAMHCLGAVRFEESARRRVSEPPSTPQMSIPLRSATTPRSIDAANFAPAPTARLKPAVPGGPMPPQPPLQPMHSPPSGTSVPSSSERPLSHSSPANTALPKGLVPSHGPPETWDDSTTPQPEGGGSVVDPPPAARAPVPMPPTGNAPGPLSSASTPLSSDARPIDGDVDRLFEAERHFRRGNRALERERWSEALTAFEQAAALCPNEGEFVAYVAWARHCAAPDARESTERALAELDRAVELAPQLFVVNLLRARVLGHAGLRAEARAAYQRVLSLEPSSDEARAALARLEGR